MDKWWLGPVITLTVLGIFGMTYYLNRERTTHWLEDNEQWIEDHKANMISLATSLFVNMQIILLINTEKLISQE